MSGEWLGVPLLKDKYTYREMGLEIRRDDDDIDNDDDNNCGNCGRLVPRATKICWAPSSPQQPPYLSERRRKVPRKLLLFIATVCVCVCVCVCS